MATGARHSVVNSLATFRDRIIGIDTLVPLLDGSEVPYLNLDNAASTPPLRVVVDAIGRYLPLYSSVHRGTGFKSRLSTAAYDRAHQVIAAFVGADPETNAVILGKNTTEAINKLAHRLELPTDAVVLTTCMEHHSNDLPWRPRAKVIHAGVTPDGRLDEDDFDRQLERFGARVALVAVSGASNVSGFVQPVHRLARKVHAVGGRILVDAAQLAPHRPVTMKPDDDPEHLDFVALSAHKMYAPFGTGALIGPKEIFLASPPEYRGGGTVDAVTLDEVYWAGMPDRDEAGTPNVVGAVAMAVAASTLRTVGMQRIADHEDALISYALERLPEVRHVRIYGETDPARSREKVGVLPFNVEGVPHALVAAVLGYEGGIGVRHGCFCAHPYVVHLLQLSEEESRAWRAQAARGDKSRMPGMVRVSFGCYNTTDDIDRLVEMLHRVARGEHRAYRMVPLSGEYLPEGYEDRFTDFFELPLPPGVPAATDPRMCGG